ncbi:ammonium transporter [Methylobacillus caricis]|uniref:ammonium transporter n=1 Tax=Methylobacillus caricis TaxID=1971611 RepID=UPI001CFFF613|nr:ammonium transporter [Methylobacillus caricis]MCB5187149.1 ammonium transporter [Methylobacillus caricis]
MQIFLFPLSAFFCLYFLGITAVSAGDGASQAQAMDSVWVAISGALVFMMQAGFAMLESGMARAKNAVNVMMKNYMDLAVGALLFWLVGYGLMFGGNPSGWIGTDHFALAYGDDWSASMLFFQVMFAATAATIVSGAMAERTSFVAYLLGACGIMALIYPVFGSWAWNEHGWLKQMGFIDFAGSTVVHSVGAWCALAGIMVLGPRLGRFGSKGEVHMIPGHNLGLVAMGGFLLWFGWFGFNGGSTLAAGAEIGPILLNTHMAGSAGAVGALLTTLAMRQPVLMAYVVNGSLGGLVAITAGCASMDVPYAVLTGFMGGIVTMFGVWALEKLRLDDVVGAVAVHGFSGVWGTIAAGLFLKGNMFDLNQVIVQLIGVAVAFVWVFLSALLMYGLLARTIGLRVSTMHEQRGLDITEHDEVGYPEFNRDAAYQREHVQQLNRL